MRFNFALVLLSNTIPEGKAANTNPNTFETARGEIICKTIFVLFLFHHFIRDITEIFKDSSKHSLKRIVLSL